MRDLYRKLRDKSYRDEFVSAQIDFALSIQIRTLRDKRGWSQKDLGDKIGLPQSGVSRLESPGHAFSVATLKKIASAFDVALVVRLAPFSELAEWSLDLSQETHLVPSFLEDSGFGDAALAQATGLGVDLHRQDSMTGPRSLDSNDSTIANADVFIHKEKVRVG